jgi:hypothetical protein
VMSKQFTYPFELKCNKTKKGFVQVRWTRPVLFGNLETGKPNFRNPVIFRPQAVVEHSGTEELASAAS